MSERFDAEFFLDPICPWCWLTSRWVTNVSDENGLAVRWRFISLRVVNEERMDGYADRHRASFDASFQSLRVLDAVREGEGNDAVAAVYTALGTEIHVNQRGDDFAADTKEFIGAALKTAGVDISYADHVDDESHDATLRDEVAVALSRTGPDVGTPIITFDPDGDNPRSLFGPVIAKAPRGADAVELWDAVTTIARSGVAEIKRSLRGDIDFT